MFGFKTGYAGSADDNFYKGKTIRLIVAFSAGGGYDTYSRAIARHLSKHIPGNPAVIVENMTGAGIIHANFIYQQGKPDGLIIGNNAGGLFLQPLMGAKGIEFDGKKSEFIGVPGPIIQHAPLPGERCHLDGAVVCRQGADQVRRRRAGRYRV